MTSSAILSDDRKYRYQLIRRWSDEPLVNFVGYNPSTADEKTDDPTIRREIGFAKDLGYGGLIKTNLFAWRSTEKRYILTTNDPVGIDNDRHILEAAKEVGTGNVIFAWGVIPGRMANRESTIVNLLLTFSPRCLRMTESGFPEHPLYLPSSLKPIAYVGRPQ